MTKPRDTVTDELVQSYEGLRGQHTAARTSAHNRLALRLSRVLRSRGLGYTHKGVNYSLTHDGQLVRKLTKNRNRWKPIPSAEPKMRRLVLQFP